MKYLVIPDSFKGSMTAKTVCGVLNERILAADPDAVVSAYPAFDGGEGSAECLTEIYGGRMIRVSATNATGRSVPSTFGMKDGTAFIAVADTSGLPSTKIRNPFVTTTRETVRSLGRSNITFCRTSSQIERRPRAPVCRSIALLAI